jgi:hypothetical protein
MVYYTGRLNTLLLVFVHKVVNVETHTVTGVKTMLILPREIKCMVYYIGN